MGIGGALRELGRFLDECEQRHQIDNVALADDCNPGATGQVTADVELTLSTCPSPGERSSVSLAGTNVDDDGRLRLSFESVVAVVPERTDGVELEPTAASFDADGTVSVTLTASTSVADGAAADGGAAVDDAAADGGAAVDDAAADGGAAVDSGATFGSTVTADGSDGDELGQDECSTPGQLGTTTAGDLLEQDEVEPKGKDEAKEVATDEAKGFGNERDVPPFQNPELLQEVYESCDTFAAMSDAIEMDVTAETVRRYMIDAGIHEPSSYDVAGADDAAPEPADAEADLQSPVLVTDGIGLPDDVSVDTLVETVRTSSTIYEVKTDIGIGRDEALEMLRQLDLLDHVVGRLATKDERDVSRELVVERLRQNAEPR